MSFYDLPKVRPEKEIKPLKGMGSTTAYKKFVEKIVLKKQLQKQLKKCNDDLQKYYLTYTNKL